jgi:hypothetical protein
MPKPHKAFDYATTAVIAVLAVAVSPVTIRLVTGRADLSLRINIVSIALVTFLLIILCALLTRVGPAVVLLPGHLDISICNASQP